VRPATADPQASGQANKAASALGTFRKLPAIIFSISGAIGSTGVSILTSAKDCGIVQNRATTLASNSNLTLPAKGDGFVIATLFAKQIAANVAARQVRDNLFVPIFSA
jgi:hypothetical protein